MMVLGGLLLSLGGTGWAGVVSTSEGNPFPGRVQGSGTVFQVTDSAFLNVTLSSSQEIVGMVESSPRVILLLLEAIAGAVSAQMTLSGLEPNTVYYMYQDGVSTDPVTTDGSGSTSWVQDLAQPRTVHLQPEKSTYNIYDSPTGGDCTQIGDWDPVNKVCMINRDLVADSNFMNFEGAITVSGGGITLDGNNHLLTSPTPGKGYGVYLTYAYDCVVRRLRISNYNTGILMGYTRNRVEDNDCSNNLAAGIAGYRITNSTIRGNTCVDNGGRGIEVGSNTTGGFNTIENNTCLATGPNKQLYGIVISNNASYWKDAGNAIVRGNRVEGNDLSGILLAGDAHHSFVTSNLVENNAVRDLNSWYLKEVTGGIVVWGKSANNVIRNNIIRENGGYDLRFATYYSEWDAGWSPEYAAKLDLSTNVVEGNIGSGNRPIGFFTQPVTLENTAFSEVVLLEADNSVLNNVVVAGSDTLRNNGILSYRTANATFNSVDSSGNFQGLNIIRCTKFFANMGHDTVTNSRFVGNADLGVSLAGENALPDGSLISGNLISANGNLGLLAQVNNGTVTCNDLTLNPVGLSMEGAGNRIYNNNLIGNGRHAFFNYDGVGVYNLDRPVGGNFWSGWESPDADHDGFVDAPYLIGGATYDLLPWATPSGWTANQAPFLDPVGNRVGAEGQLLTIKLSATDPDGDVLTYTAANLPPGASFDSATGTLSWVPGYDQAGNYPGVEFTVMDSGTPMQLDMEVITITIGDVNRAPVFNNLGARAVNEYDTLTFLVQATDPDGDLFSLFAGALPPGAVFDGATGIFTWRPDGNQAGVYPLSFFAVDEGYPPQTSQMDVVVTVGAVTSPTELADEIIEEILLKGFPGPVENSYLAHLKKVEQFVTGGQVTSAVNQVEQFIDRISQDVQKGTISASDAELILQMAEDLLALLLG